MAVAEGGVDHAARRRLGFAAAGVLLGAADTYVVVIVLPAIMSAVGLDLAHLDQATPIISGFLLGYVVVLPLLGRLSDLYGRGPILVISLVIFAAGSLVTGSANSLWAVVLGRTMQGAGGGGLVPVTLAMVADRWSADRRGVPLGVIGAMQEFGSVAGPLYGAALGAAAGWRAIFYVNLPIAGIIATGVRAGAGRGTLAARRDLLGIALAVIASILAVLAVAAPPALADSLTVGTLYTPLIGDVYASTPIVLTAVVTVLAFLAREVTVPAGTTALLPLRTLQRLARGVDWTGALLIGLVLAAIVAVFASADPAVSVVGGSAPLLVPLAVVFAVLFVRRELRTVNPLIDLRALHHRAAAGALLANLAIGAALMAALVDIPVFARATVDPDSQVDAALVLARLLIAIPVGAVMGGMLVGRLGYRAVAGAGMLLAAVMFVLMADWSATSLSDPLFGLGWLHPSDPVLFACGLGFGLSVVPVTAAILGAVPAAIHGVAASLTVAARMVGMLTGLSLLTAIGLQRFYATQATLPTPSSLCPTTPLNCAAYNVLEARAILDELHVIFIGAAVCALLASLVAAGLLGRERRASARLALGSL